MIAMIDYDAGNIKSVEKAFQYLGQDVRITRDRDEILAADHVVLPGVGSFGDAMKHLKEYHLIPTIYDVVDKKIPFLGICLGLQLMFDGSDESRGVSGLGILPGTIEAIPPSPGLKIPHMGWNSLKITPGKRLYQGIEDGAYVYFVHSYCAVPKEENLVAWTEYGGQIPALVWDGAYCYGAQFHPEKSGEPGLVILRNFADLCQDVSQRKTSKEGFSHDTASRH